MKDFFTKATHISNPAVRKTVGIILVIWGLVALVTPFTPGAWLAFIGLELLGARYLLEKQLKTLDKLRGAGRSAAKKVAQETKKAKKKVTKASKSR